MNSGGDTHISSPWHQIKLPFWLQCGITHYPADHQCIQGRINNVLSNVFNCFHWGMLCAPMLGDGMHNNKIEWVITIEVRE